MKITNFNKGIISSSFGSFWWGVLGTYYFQYISFVGTLEVVVHRCVWTTLILLITTTIFNKWILLKKSIQFILVFLKILHHLLRLLLQFDYLLHLVYPQTALEGCIVPQLVFVRSYSFLTVTIPCLQKTFYFSMLLIVFRYFVVHSAVPIPC